MRVRQALIVLAAVGITAGCTEHAELLAPSRTPALDGGILTIGSDGRAGSSGSSQTTTGTSSDSTTSLSGILTIGSGG
jgi:hypothetical protein